MTKHKRIDLTQFEGLTTPWDFGKKYPHIESAKVAVDLIAELKKSYETIDYLATHAMVTGDFCPMCLTSLDERCQHIIWEVDLAPPGTGLLSVTNKPGYRTTFGVWNPERHEEEQHVHWEHNSLKPRDEQ